MKKLLLFVFLFLIVSCQRADYSTKDFPYKKEYAHSKRYRYKLFYPYGEEGASLDYRIYKEKYLSTVHLSTTLLLDLQNPVPVNIFYIDSDDQIKRKVEKMIITPNQVDGIGDWGMLIETNDWDFLYLFKSKTIYRFNKVYGRSNTCEQRLETFPVGIPLRYEYNDLKDFLTKTEYDQCYNRYDYYYIPVRIDKKGNITFDSETKGHLTVLESQNVVDLNDSPKYIMTSLSYKDFHSTEAKSRVASNVRQRYSVLMEQARKAQLKDRAISPASIVDEYKKNAVKAEENLVGKYFILKNLSLTNIYSEDSWKNGNYYKYAVSVKYNTGSIFSEYLTLYTNDEAFVSLSYPESDKIVEGRLSEIGEYLVFTEVTLLDL